MGMDEIVECTSVALQNTSGEERRMYENISLYLQTQNPLYMNEAQKKYRRLSPEAQSRAHTYYSVLTQYVT